MNVDVAYISKNKYDWVWSFRRFVGQECSPLVIACPTGEKLLDKKIIAVGNYAVRNKGIFVTVGNFENIAPILYIIKEEKLQVQFCTFYQDKVRVTGCPERIMIIVPKGPSMAPSCIIDDDTLESLVINGSSSPQDVVITLGNDIFAFAKAAKRRCRYSIHFGEEPLEALTEEGMRVEAING